MAEQYERSGGAVDKLREHGTVVVATSTTTKSHVHRPEPDRQCQHIQQLAEDQRRTITHPGELPLRVQTCSHCFSEEDT